MNLRDKLNMMGAPKPKVKPQAAPPAGCYHTCHVHELSEFPGCFDIGRAEVMLMQGEEMPEDFGPLRILYLDTETTGFQGAGTVAFIIGAGYLTEDGFQVHQFVLRDYPEEPAQLQALDALLERFDVLCTFNGRTFDVPLLRTRYLMNRMKPALLEKPHIDLLHIARRVFKLRLKQCNLGHLEEALLGQPRENDLPGSEAPGRFFAYLKTGEFHLLDEVLEHNEQDIASLCTLLSYMCQVYRQPEQLSFSEDVYAMGIALERMHHPEEARRCYHLVSGRYHAPSQLRLAQSWRRSGDPQASKDIYLRMLALHEGGVHPYIALAKHYEHQERDIPAALDMTRRAMMLLAEPSLLDDEDTMKTRDALQKRYERLLLRLSRQNGNAPS